MAGFTTISNNLLENEEFSIQEQSLLITIISYSGKGNANPSYKGLKRRSKIKKDETLLKALEGLIQKGYITKYTEKGKRNLYKPTPKTEYLQKWSISENGGTPTPKTELLPPPKMEYKKEIKKEKEKINNVHFKQAEELWQLYPSKIGKGKVINKIPKLIEKEGYEQLKNCIERYIRYVEKRRGEDFKELKYQNGSTFFNSGYIDYLDSNYEDIKNSDTKSKEKKKPKNLLGWD